MRRVAKSSIDCASATNLSCLRVCYLFVCCFLLAALLPGDELASVVLLVVLLVDLLGDLLADSVALWISSTLN